jgi:pimeloyl-ACP methyl ester carboxylesterase
MPDTGKVRFVIPGRRIDAPRRRDQPEEITVLASARRGSGSEGDVELEAEPGDHIEIELVNGPELILHPQTARLLLEAQRTEAGPRGSTEETADGVRVPTRLAWGSPLSDAASRGAASSVASVVMRAFRLVKNVLSPGEAMAEAGATLLATAAAQRVDSQVKSGLYQLSTDVLRPEAVSLSSEGASADMPLLVLVHGTFSTITTGFGKLWSEQPGLVRDLAGHYRGRVYGFEHPTLCASPITNALELVNALPMGARVHFLTHSRGGLVAEALARLAPNPDGVAKDLKPFDSPKYAEQANELTKLMEALRTRRIQVERVVRVGCPTRGTLLASGRLDAYLSILKWTLQLSGIPVAPQVVSFLSEVAQRRSDPTLLPGLEAMMPESAFIRWLHAEGEPLAGDLRVVAGDVQGDSVTSWLKTLASDAFYWTDNDLVVQTRSMYGGRPRVNGSLFWLEQGAKISHNGYFAQANTARAVSAALIRPSPEGFQPIGPRSSAGLDSSGRREARARRSDAAAESRPAVVLLPGILGSHLEVDGQRIWFGPRFFNGLSRLAYVEADPRVNAGGVLEWVYGKLIEHLDKTHEVFPFSFDWRRPIEEEARRLAVVLTQAMNERRASRQPVRMIAHSMGGLVARALEIEVPNVWQRFVSQNGARLLMLGTPNTGSWAPMQVLSGDSALGDVLDSVGVLFDEVRARRLFAALPGFLQLQASLLDQSTGLGKSERWSELAEGDRRVLSLNLIWHSLDIQKRVADWGIPSQSVLDAAQNFQRKLQSQRLRGDRVMMVLGSAKSTPSGFSVARDGHVEYAAVPNAGDGTVPDALALLDGVPAWRAQGTSHLALAYNRQLFAGYSFLLEKGTLPASRLFQRVGAGASTSRGRAAGELPASSRIARYSQRRGFTPEVLWEPLQQASGRRDGTSGKDGDAGVPELHLVVTNGNLMFVSQPLLLGHYRSLALSGAEEQMDELIGKTMSQSLRMRRYPSALGSCQVFNNLQPAPDNPFVAPRPKAVVVVGLGEEGALRPPGLSLSVEQAVIAYSQVVAEGKEPTSSFELATTLLGSGGIGMAVGGSAHALAQGVRAANIKLLEHGWPIVSTLEFVELYEDRAIEALRALHEEAERAPDRFSVEPALRKGTDPLRRPEHASYRGAVYDFVSAVKGAPLGNEDRIAYVMDTRRARTEERATSAPLGILRSLIASAIDTDRSDAGRTLFKLIVPRELDASLGGSDAVVLEVDDLTAPIPWELLTTDSDTDPGSEPWSIRCKLLRKRRVKDFRDQPLDSGRQASVLAIGAPKCDTTKYPHLPGALSEARAVAQLFPDSIELLEAEAPAVIGALFEGPYRIVHISGHGKEDGSGVVLSDDNVLGHSLVEQMRRVPELVFVNCCHSGREVMESNIGPNALGIARPRFAATIAAKLISMGVRCVVAAGWAVDDDAAERFAREFYDGLRKGQPFILAVTVARRSTFREFPNSNTWAAYQCYGDPDWVLETAGDEPLRAPRVASAAPPRQPLILSPSALRVALDAAAMSGQFTDDNRRDAHARIASLEHSLGERWGDEGAVAESFASAYAKIGEMAKAIAWYERAASCEDGGASQRGLEQLGNLRILSAAERVEDAYVSWRRDHDAEAFGRVINTARDEIDRTSKLLENLFGIHPTIELACVLGSSQKRVAMIEQLAVQALEQPSDRWITALRKTIDHYKEAEARARAADQPLFYAISNRLCAEYVIDRIGGSKYSPDEKLCDELDDDIERRIKEGPNFWNLVQREELRAHRAVCRETLSKNVRAVTERLADLHQRLASPRSWRSVRDQWRFVLRAYVPGASEGERAAAEELLRTLERYAGPPASEDSAPEGPSS